MRWLDGISNSMNMNLKKIREIVKDREAWQTVVRGVERVRQDLETKPQQQCIQYILKVKLTNKANHLFWGQSLNFLFVIFFHRLIDGYTGCSM